MTMSRSAVGSAGCLVLLVAPATALADRPAGCLRRGRRRLHADRRPADRRLGREARRHVRRHHLHHAARPAGSASATARASSTSTPARRSADSFPYGRRDARRSRSGRIATARRSRSVVFQNGDENNLSHPFAQSSPEPPPYCRPIQPTEAELRQRHLRVGRVHRQGHVRRRTRRSLYPPRADIDAPSRAPTRRRSRCTAR